MKTKVLKIKAVQYGLEIVCQANKNINDIAKDLRRSPVNNVTC